MRQIVIANSTGCSGWGALKPGIEITSDDQLKINMIVLFELEHIKNIVKVVKKFDEYFYGVIIKQGKPIGGPFIVSVKGQGRLYKPKGY